MGRLSYTTQEVQDRLDSVGQIVRPNLLDNAFFVGGGSQQGMSQLPINQRGATSYNAGAYSIDRWYNRQYITASLVNGGLKLSITQTGGYPFFTQRLENSDILLGRTVTLSFLLSEVGDSFKGIRFGLSSANSVGTNTTDLGVTGWATTSGLYSVTYAVPSTIAHTGINAGFYLGATNRAAGDYCVISACKLELGEIQTLAHWDDATLTWALNEIPNYQQEYARCRRFFKKQTAGGMSGYGAINASGEQAFITIPYDVPMRTVPTTTFTSFTGIRANGTLFSSYTSVTPWSSTNNPDGAHINVSGTFTGAGNRACALEAIYELSADL